MIQKKITSALQKKSEIKINPPRPICQVLNPLPRVKHWEKQVTNKENNENQIISEILELTNDIEGCDIRWDPNNIIQKGINKILTSSHSDKVLLVTISLINSLIKNNLIDLPSKTGLYYASLAIDSKNKDLHKPALKIYKNLILKGFFFKTVEFYTAMGCFLSKNYENKPSTALNILFLYLSDNNVRISFKHIDEIIPGLVKVALEAYFGSDSGKRSRKALMLLTFIVNRLLIMKSKDSGFIRDSALVIYFSKGSKRYRANAAVLLMALVANSYAKYEKKWDLTNLAFNLIKNEHYKKRFGSIILSFIKFLARLKVKV